MITIELKAVFSGVVEGLLYKNHFILIDDGRLCPYQVHNNIKLEIHYESFCSIHNAIKWIDEFGGEK